MKIKVRETPECIWELEGENFFCTHNEVEIEEGVVDYYDPSDQYGHGQFETEYYVCADPDCGEQLEGSPAEDRYESMVDAEIDRMREDGY